MSKNGGALFEINSDMRGHDRYSFPDQLSFENEPYATVIPNRSSSVFKVHRTEALANSALAHHREGAKYKQVSGVWVKVWEFYEPENCERCNTGRLDNDKDTGCFGRWLQSPLHRGSRIFAPFLCRNCYDAEKQVVDDRNRAKAWRAEQKRRENFDKNN